jgi:hypothetical protein
MRFFAERCSIERNASDTGDAGACAAPLAVKQQRASAVD